MILSSSLIQEIMMMFIEAKCIRFSLLQKYASLLSNKISIKINNHPGNIMIKQIFISTSLCLTATFTHARVGIDYLNDLRTKAGLPVFTEQVNLNESAQNHSDYMQINSVFSHNEASADTGYTGYRASDRAIYAGYFSRTVSENVSYGAGTVQDSVDGLFSAIYHRFGFLTLSSDEIGIGISSDDLFYTYNMGNSILNDLCENSTYSGGSYYPNVCADTEKKIDASDYLGASGNIKAASPDLILWPAMNADDIPPVFYEEYPDPLPSHSVTAYPVSVEFNTKSFSSAPAVSSFTLENIIGDTLNDITVMDEANDPNSKFTAYQFSLFPEKRLEWGSEYHAEIIYTYDGVQNMMNWCFTTRTLEGTADKFYRIENNGDITLDVMPGDTYAIYVVPDSTNDTLDRVSYSYNSDTPVFSYIDGNTISVNMTGNNSAYSAFTFENGQKITLTLASSDTASVPANASCTVSEDDFDDDGIPDSTDTDDDNDGMPDVYENSITELDSLDASDADEDLDQDGATNLEEYQAGTDPLDKTDTPAITSVSVNPAIIMYLLN